MLPDTTRRTGEYQAMSLNALSELPREGFVRVGTLAKVLGISVVTVWRWSASGKLPQPVKLSARITAWRTEDIRCWMHIKNNQANSIQ
ncbi:helix-turn-helix transcriptional regulator [Aeromonas veronii]|uniref:helix-turn-helix transcriptional regulator n=1 Tax=Aeromonas veronii TaxID=654 RepID=UPI0030CE8D25